MIHIHLLSHALLQPGKQPEIGFTRPNSQSKALLHQLHSKTAPNSSLSSPSHQTPPSLIDSLPEQVPHIDIASLNIGPDIDFRPAKSLQLTLDAKLKDRDPPWFLNEIAAEAILQEIGAIGVFGCKPNAAFAVEVVEGAHLFP